MLQAALALRRTFDPAAGAARNRLFFQTHDRRTAYRARRRHHKRLRIGRTRLGHIGHHFRNHIAGATYDHGVADLDILAAHFVFVVQRGIGDRHAANEYRHQTRHRRDGTGTADLHFYALHHGQCLLRRKLVRQRETRCARDETELLLLVETIDLVDHTVDLVRQLAALGTDAVIERQQTVGPLYHGSFLAHRQAERG